MKKVWTYIYFIWLSANICVLAYSMKKSNSHTDDPLGLDLDLDLDLGFGSGSINKSAFFPFETSNIQKYDLSEFLVYAIAIPLFIFAIAKLILLFVHRKAT